jgi:hypothetical protein
LPIAENAGFTATPLTLTIFIDMPRACQLITMKECHHVFSHFNGSNDFYHYHPSILLQATLRSCLPTGICMLQADRFLFLQRLLW